MLRDIDLQSIQEVRNYLEEAKSAQAYRSKNVPRRDRQNR